MLISRRNFIQTMAGSAFLMGFPEISIANKLAGSRRLLVILLRGGMDGLTAISPIGDPDFRSMRAHIQVQGAKKLNDFFAIHPSFKFVQEQYQDGHAAFVHATSFPYTGRSHFDGQNVMESGAEAPNTSNTGWVGRAMAASGLGSMAFSLPIPLILQGNVNATNHYPSTMIGVPNAVYEAVFENWNDRQSLGKMVSKIDDQRRLGSMRRSPGALVSFATDQMAKPDGPRVGLIDLVGFDTHAIQGNGTGKQAEIWNQLDYLIQQFRVQMGDLWAESVVVTVTEFGRTVKENGSQGTDHGWGSALFLVGGLVKKSSVVTDWPGLKTSQLYEGRDLKVTIDARDIYSEIVSKVFDVDPDRVSKEVFLGYKPKKDYSLLKS